MKMKKRTKLDRTNRFLHAEEYKCVQIGDGTAPTLPALQYHDVNTSVTTSDFLTHRIHRLTHTLTYIIHYISYIYILVDRVQIGRSHQQGWLTLYTTANSVQIAYTPSANHHISCSWSFCSKFFNTSRPMVRPASAPAI